MAAEIDILRRELKDRTSEVDQLKKKVLKAEKDRQQWESQKKQLESKLPMDVKQLISEKRELTMQLNREQNEKHDLFLQINSMIAQLAESKPVGDFERLKSENADMKRQIEDLENSLSSESLRLEGDLKIVRDESAIAKHSHEIEKKKMMIEIEEIRKELHMKSAALQSLMLAKQDTGKLEKLTGENENLNKQIIDLQLSLQATKEELSTKTIQVDKLQQSSYLNSETQRILEELKTKLRETEVQLNAEIMLKTDLEVSNKKFIAAAQLMEEELVQMKRIQEDNERIICSLKNEREILEKEAQSESEENRRWEFERGEEMKTLKERLEVLEATLKEKDAKIDSTTVKLLAAESRIAQAESDQKSSDQLAKNSERRAQQLQAQIDTFGNSDAEIALLRDNLKKAEDRHNLVLSRLQRAEDIVQESARENKFRIETLEKELKDAYEEIEKAQEKQRHSKAIDEQMTILRSEFDISQKNFEESRNKVSSLESELKELKTEKKKLESKASVAEELTTLMASLSAMRQENELYQDEIQSLHCEVRQLREDNEHAQEEIAEWKVRADVAEREKDSMEAEIDKEKERIILLTSSHETDKVELTENLAAKSKLEIENNKLKEEICKLQNSQSVLHKERTKLEVEYDDLQQNSSSQLFELKTLKQEATKLQDENSRLKGEIENLKQNYEILRSSAEVKEREKKETENESSKKLQDLRDKYDALQREADSSRSRICDLEYEQTRVLGSSDEEKQRLLEECRKYREKFDTLDLEVVVLRDKLKEALEKNMMLEKLNESSATRLTNLEKENYEVKSVLKSSQEILDKMKETEMLAEKTKQQLEILENEYLEKIQKFTTENKENEEKYKSQLDEMKMVHQQQMEKLEKERDAMENKNKRTIEELRNEISISTEKHKQELEELERKLQDNIIEPKREIDELTEQKIISNRLYIEDKEKLNKKILDLETKLATANKSHDSMVTNMRNMTSVLESEAARLEEIAAEKRRWQEEAEEKGRLLEEAREEVKDEKIDELVAENARLASELLKSRSEAEKMLNMEREQITRQFAEKLKTRKDEIATIHSELSAVKNERSKLRDEIESLRSNGHPVPPPRRTISNMSNFNYNTQTDFSEVEDVHKLRSEIDKQKRLIIVLRRKLQGIQ